jgi:serine/threonine protein kinase
MPTDQPQTIGKYQVQSLLGKGATSHVYKGFDPFSGQHVAIKVLSHEALQDPVKGPRYRRAFLNEASLSGKLEHPHILRILDAVADDSQSYLVMEFVEGRPLTHHCRPENLLPLEKVVEIIFKCCRALNYAFQNGIIHRDIKPDNILITRTGEPKIADFGAALFYSAQETQIGGFVGSPAYMSPEQIKETPLTEQADIFSMGVVLYELLTGSHPFQSENDFTTIYKILNESPVSARELRSDLPETFESIINKAMAKDRNGRYQDWSFFASDLSAAHKQMELPKETLVDHEKFEVLRSSQFFADFTDSEVWEVTRMAKWKRFPAGTTIIHEGDHGSSFFVLGEGAAKVFKQGRFINRLQSGQSFGEMACFAEIAKITPDVPRAATVITETEALLVKIKSDGVLACTSSCQAGFYRAFIRSLADRLRMVNEKLAASCTKINCPNKE